MFLAGKDVYLSAFEMVSDQEIWQDGNTVAYYTGSYTLVTSAFSFGFIYSADGNPHPKPDMNNYPCTKTARKIRWQQPNGDDFCELIPITNNFFYFKIGY